MELLPTLPQMVAAEGNPFVVQKPSGAMLLWRATIKAQRLALEILTDAIAGDDDAVAETEWEAMEDMTDDDCMNAFTGDPQDASDSCEVGAALVAEGGSYPQILARAGLIPEELRAHQSPLAQEMVEELDAVSHRVCALVANIIRCIPAQSKLLFLSWGAMRTLAFSDTVSPQTAMEAVRAMGALLQHAKEIEAEDFLRVACDEALVTFLCRLAKAPCKAFSSEAGAVEEEVQVAVTAMCGVVGEVQHDKPIAEGVLTALGCALESQSLSVAAEALNAVFDMFADDEANDAIFRAHNMFDQLQTYLPTYKGRVKDAVRGGSLQPVVMDRAQEAALNLKRFLAYKRK